MKINLHKNATTTPASALLSCPIVPGLQTPHWKIIIKTFQVVSGRSRNNLLGLQPNGCAFVMPGILFVYFKSGKVDFGP
jgi:hypothetical protein